MASLLQVGKRGRKGGGFVEAPAGGIQGKNLGSPDEVRSFDKGKMDVVTLGNVTVGLATFEPGWQWFRVRQAGCGYRQLPGSARRVRALGADKGRYGRRLGGGVQPRRRRGDPSGTRRLGCRG